MHQNTTPAARAMWKAWKATLHPFPVIASALRYLEELAIIEA